MFCEGVYDDFKKPTISSWMSNFSKYAYVSCTSPYKIQKFGSYKNMYSKYCTGKGINFSGHSFGMRFKECD